MIAASLTRFFRLADIFLISLMILTWQACQNSDLPPGDADQGGLAITDGFEALVVADSVGKARHIAVSEDGYIYVKLRRPHEKIYGNVALRDSTGDGKADEMKYFGTYPSRGTLANGMTIHKRLPVLFFGIGVVSATIKIWSTRS